MDGRRALPIFDRLFGRSPAPSIPTVRFDPSRVTDTVVDNIAATLTELNIVPERHWDAVFKTTVASVKRGRDLAMMCRALKGIGVSKRDAEHAARLVHCRASAIMKIDEWTRLGIAEAKWLWPGVDCILSDPDDVRGHREANGKRYRVEQGLLINGRYVAPGMDDGCRCVSNAVIPGVD